MTSARFECLLQSLAKAGVAVSPQANFGCFRMYVSILSKVHLSTILFCFQVEENTASSMKKLVEIDGVKCRMQDACNALQEADKWTILSSEAEEAFESGDFNQVRFFQL